MEEANRYGKTSPFMKDTGEIIKLMEEVDSFIPMVMFMRENGRMIRLMGKVCITIMMAPAIMESGMRMFNKASELKNGLMGHLMKGNFYFIVDNIIMDLNMDTESLSGLTCLFMKANSMKIKYRAEEEWSGLMENSMKAIGKYWTKT